MPTHVAYNTRPHERLGSRGQINKSDRAMMWLHTSSKPHKMQYLKKNRRFKALEIVKSILKNDLDDLKEKWCKYFHVATAIAMVVYSQKVTPNTFRFQQR